MAYAPATAADLKLRFPAFAAVADPTIEYWLTDARLTVKDTWPADDRGPGEMELAAHNMAVLGFGSAGGEVGELAAMGVTDFKSASMSVSFDATKVRTASSGDLDSTIYGAMFKARRRKLFGGPRLVGCHG